MRVPDELHLRRLKNRHAAQIFAAAQQSVDFKSVRAAPRVRNIVVTDEHHDRNPGVRQPFQTARKRPLMGLVWVAGFISVARKNREVDIGCKGGVHGLVQSKREIFQARVEAGFGIVFAVGFHS